MCSSGGQVQCIPLGTVQDRPALGRIPGVFVQETTQRTLTDQFSSVECGFCRGVQEHEQRSLQAALLVGRGWDGQELVRQNADALPQNL